ncbi:MAG TPA: RDD family protein [Opitutaceae bacterium]|jgi:uncharacterized RDD family membrane protein YckC
MKSRFLLLAALSLAVVTARGSVTRNLGDDDDDRGGDDNVVVMSSNHVDPHQTVHGDCVTVMGDLTMDGTVTRDCVNVLGTAEVNGTIRHDLVVIGDLKLGPNAHIDHDVVCIGHLTRDPEAFVGHQIINPAHLGHLMTPFHRISEWWNAGGDRGQYLPFAHELRWLWTLTLISLLMSILIAMIVPSQVISAGNLLVDQPGTIILSGLAALIGVPLALCLMCATGVLIPVAIVLAPVLVVFPIWYGRAAIYSLLARRIVTAELHPGVATLLGGVLVLLLAMLPFFGALCFFLLTVLAWCCAWASLFTSRRRPNRNGPPAPPVTSSPAVPSPIAAAPANPSPIVSPPAAAADGVPTSSMPPPLPPLESPLQPPQSFTVPPAPSLNLQLLPRAGFWIRTWAMLIDIVLVGIACGFLESALGGDHGPSGFLILVAAYAAILWKLRGTTLGGIICHLSVVRLDGRPIDWPTAIVRALACFVSLFVAGLGFLWIIFDVEHQSWHDKIAGTAVVVSPSRQSLV